MGNPKKETYAELLKNPLWQKKRLEIMQRDNFTCQHCGYQDKELQVHHRVYHKGAKPWEYEDSELITLCCDCHEEETESKQYLYQTFLDICSLSRKLGFSESFLLSLLNQIRCPLENMVENPNDKDEWPIIEWGIFGNPKIRDAGIAFNNGLLLSKEGKDFMRTDFKNLYEKYISINCDEED